MERWGGNWVEYFYDENGNPTYMLRYDEAVGFPQLNYFVTNLQGDVIAVCDNFHNPRFFYSYDAWGKLLSVTDANGNDVSGADNSASWNILRYRGYVYDREIGLYYVASRYYDPEIGRWINADSVIAGTGENIFGYNMFSHCFNNPVNMTDDSGHWPQWVIDVANWGKKTIIQPVVGFTKGIAKDIKNFDLINESEEKVLDSNYFSSYKGVPVIRTNGDRSGSFGTIFLTRETNSRSNPEDVLRHEYGHTKQLKQLGVLNYALCIGLPSWQQWGTGEYYSKPWEITADIYGGVRSRNHSQGNIDRGFAYLENSKILGPLIWVFIK